MLASVGFSRARTAIATRVAKSSLSRRRGVRSSTAASTKPSRASRRTARASAAPLRDRRSSRNVRLSGAPGVLHECAEDRVHAGLVAVSLLPEKLDHVLVQA